MAVFICDDAIIAVLNKVKERAELSSDEAAVLESCSSSGRLTIEGLKILQRHRESDSSAKSAISVIRGKTLVFPAFQKVALEESPEKVRRRQYLQAKIDQREYNRMVYGSERSPSEKEAESISNQLSSVRNQISIGVNMIVAIIATFGICYYVGGQFTTNVSTRMIYGLTGGILVMIMEMVLYILRAARMESLEQELALRNNSAPSTIQK